MCWNENVMGDCMDVLKKVKNIKMLRNLAVVVIGVAFVYGIVVFVLCAVGKADISTPFLCGPCWGLPHTLLSLFC